jgi:hypothetical protein
MQFNLTNVINNDPEFPGEPAEPLRTQLSKDSLIRQISDMKESE